MKKYEIKVTCEYYVEIEAETEDEAIDIASTGEGQGGYSLSDLQDFEYEVVDVDEIDQYKCMILMQQSEEIVK